MATRVPRNRNSGLDMTSGTYEHFDALFFDCDGVIAETERDAHRVTFNQAFVTKGLPSDVVWDVELYGKLLKVGGGKERMTAYFQEVGWPSVIPTSEQERAAFIADLHKIKTNNFQKVIESGVVPLRPGVERLVDEALSQGIKVAVCSTSNDAAVRTIVKKLLGEERLARIPIFAGTGVGDRMYIVEHRLHSICSNDFSPFRWLFISSFDKR